MASIARALLSVSDKSGLADFAANLAGRGIELVSTGGTAAHLRAQGLEVLDVSQLTGFPELLDGRVKTLHPAVHGALLARRDSADHRTTLAAHGIVPIDLVVVNLYPFAQTIARPGTTVAEAIEQIDIGGPAMLRSAAKNHTWVTVVCNPERYETVLDDLAAHDGATTLALRRLLAAEAFAHTADYDTRIAAYLASAEPE